MLTQAVHRDVADHDHLVVTLLEHRLQGPGRVLVEARGDLLIHAGDPAGGVAEAVAVQVLADPLQNQADAALNLVEIEAPGGGWDQVADLAVAVVLDRHGRRLSRTGSHPGRGRCRPRPGSGRRWSGRGRGAG